MMKLVGLRGRLVPFYLTERAGDADQVLTVLRIRFGLYAL